MKKLTLLAALILIAFSLSAQSRLKDISTFSGIESKELIGYGLVVGLQGTGDGTSSQMTIQSIMNMLEHFGITIPINKIRPNNVAAVMITATMPPFMRAGSRFDVNVSSIGDAKSLEGGVLLMSPLVGQDNIKYALAQGPVSFGGFNEEIRNTKMRKNYTNVGRIPNGAVLEVELENKMLVNGELNLVLNQADFTTAQRIVSNINDTYRGRIANAYDARTITITVPDSILVRNNLIGFISNVENLRVVPEQNAIVVINERTGTIVAGGNVRINEIAIAHGNLVIQVETQVTRTQVGPFGREEEETTINVKEDARVVTMQTATVEDLARALNSIKVSPRDLISIFQSIKEAGALQAELKIM
ncbi:MAG: flagellar basal body P-ring protein FlgI [Candidatus Cloacimonadales bacterium]|nr:flagellar basal body P-ring protein FlgI [Candidatus Cloacimonadota bacterium]MDD2650822.1 flagellar basal body P-ring protein FlgI [Candidatus Cloacimonadota bacterium]MDD3501659.1 flagellar basal body P-ring protein FlgI [Candidatus Cloacimonadota bacterium]MDX9977883.1 flagellar basal body P-ring protein FlgI [Candidatus Cloacimonadales bacterium]